MAILSNVSLAIEKSSSPTGYVKVTINYRLTPSRVEQMARTVFNEEFSLLSRDWLITPAEASLGANELISFPTRDTPITTVRGTAFGVNDTTSHVDRSRVFMIAKARLNEDPETTATGSEVADEVLARARVSYAANAPMPAPTLIPAFSTVLTGTWV